MCNLTVAMMVLLCQVPTTRPAVDNTYIFSGVRLADTKTTMIWLAPPGATVVKAWPVEQPKDGNQDGSGRGR